VLVFAAGQYAIAALFLRVRRSRRWRATFYAVVALALVPLALEKFLPRDAASMIGFLGISYVTFRGLDVLFVIQPCASATPA
jgi:hypothetical protein